MRGEGFRGKSEFRVHCATCHAFHRARSLGGRATFFYITSHRITAKYGMRHPKRRWRHEVIHFTGASSFKDQFVWLSRTCFDWVVLCLRRGGAALAVLTISTGVAQKHAVSSAWRRGAAPESFRRPIGPGGPIGHVYIVSYRYSPTYTYAAQKSMFYPPVFSSIEKNIKILYFSRTHRQPLFCQLGIHNTQITMKNDVGISTFGSTVTAEKSHS